MAWISLIISGMFETFAVSMINRLTIKKNWQTVIYIIIGIGMSLLFLHYSLIYIPMGTAYAIWTGISVVCSSLIGMLYFGESKSIYRIVFIALILTSAIGLKLIS
ncbi:MAG TPA: QacE family quaternary ammonium compound efflux SMR transporter [Candidatus Nosocomiicoccus stercorigallinarum]|nr:QacE family quaternary ammonium compound efflux SMR transporter [Candidatus Nosocomiicoccus stercorigallinarum]